MYKKINNSGNIILDIGVISFVVLISIGYATTNEMSRLFVVPIRVASICLILTSLFILLVSRRFRSLMVFEINVYLLFFVWGCFLAVAYGSFALIGVEKYFVDLVITLVGFIFLASSSSIFTQRHAVCLVVYVLLILLLTILTGGFIFDFPPRFDFSAGSEIGDVSLYSQGVTKFYAVGAICSFYLAVVIQSRFKTIFISMIGLVFIVLSFLGGARGDSVGALIVIFCFMLYKAPVKTFIYIVAIFLLFLFLDDWSWLEGFVLFRRLIALDADNMGERDILFGQVIDLLENMPICLISGCGFNFFQKYFGYEFGMYPHNYISEALITFGFPIFFVATIISFLGFIYYSRSSNSSSLFILLFLYYFILALKGGYLLGHWYLNASMLYFIFYFFQISRFFKSFKTL